MEDLGKKEKMAGREIYSHIAWADKMGMVVKGAKIETTTTYIGHIRKELPEKKLEEVTQTGQRFYKPYGTLTSIISGMGQTDGRRNRTSKKH